MCQPPKVQLHQREVSVGRDEVSGGLRSERAVYLECGLHSPGHGASDTFGRIQEPQEKVDHLPHVALGCGSPRQVGGAHLVLAYSLEGGGSEVTLFGRRNLRGGLNVPLRYHSSQGNMFTHSGHPNGFNF